MAKKPNRKNLRNINVTISFNRILYILYDACYVKQYDDLIILQMARHFELQNTNSKSKYVYEMRPWLGVLIEIKLVTGVFSRKC